MMNQEIQPVKNYILGNIRRLLTEGFTKEELNNDLCYDELEFRPFLDRLPKELPKELFIGRLLEYAEQNLLVDALLAWIRNKKLARYNLHQPYYCEQLEEEVVADELLVRKDLKTLFHLSEEKTKITIYLSRHTAAAQLPTITTGKDKAENSKAVNDPIFKKILDNENLERKSPAQKKIEVNEFAVISAIEMLEAVWLKNEIERRRLFVGFSNKAQEELKKVIEVNIKVCPEPAKYEEILGEGTVIFIGGTRANLGTYYYLYIEEAGKARPRRLPKEVCEKKAGDVQFTWWTKDVIECIKDPDIFCYPNVENHNLAVIQKYNRNNDAIIYLAGTGVYGTAAAVAYFRKKWPDLINDGKDFVKVIEVPRRKAKKEDLTNYGPDYWWTENKWREVKEFSCHSE